MHTFSNQSLWRVYRESAKIVWFVLKCLLMYDTFQVICQKDSHVRNILRENSFGITRTVDARVQNEFVYMVRFWENSLQKGQAERERLEIETLFNNISIQLIQNCLTHWKTYETIAMWNEKLTEYKFRQWMQYSLPLVTEVLLGGFLWVQIANWSKIIMLEINWNDFRSRGF